MTRVEALEAQVQVMAAEIADCGVTCRQIAGMLDTAVDAFPHVAQLVDTLTGIGRLARSTGERLREIAA